MKRRLVPAVLAPIAALTVASPAGAAVFSGSATDPADGPVASIDARSISTAIDTNAGTWTTTYTFRGRRTARTRADIQLSFELSPKADGTPKQGGFVLVKLRGFKTTTELHDEQLGPQEDTTQDTATATRTPHRLTITVRDARLAALEPVALSQSRISYRARNTDYVPRFALTSTP